jgi:hypothetical protein
LKSYTALEWLEEDPLALKKHRILAHLKAGVEKGATAGRNVIAIAHAIAMAASKPPGPEQNMRMFDVIHELLHFSGGMYSMRALLAQRN